MSMKMIYLWPSPCLKPKWYIISFFFFFFWRVSDFYPPHTYTHTLTHINTNWHWRNQNVWIYFFFRSCEFETENRFGRIHKKKMEICLFHKWIWWIEKQLRFGRLKIDFGWHILISINAANISKFYLIQFYSKQRSLDVGYNTYTIWMYIRH